MLQQIRKGNEKRKEKENETFSAKGSGFSSSHSSATTTSKELAKALTASIPPRSDSTLGSEEVGPSAAGATTSKEEEDDDEEEEEEEDDEEGEAFDFFVGEASLSSSFWPAELPLLFVLVGDGVACFILFPLVAKQPRYRLEGLSLCRSCELIVSKEKSSFRTLLFFFWFFLLLSDLRTINFVVLCSFVMEQTNKRPNDHGKRGQGQ